MPGVTFSYNGTEIADSSLMVPGRRILKSQGKYCDGDIAVDFENPDIWIKPKKDGKTRLYLTIPKDCDLDKLAIPLYWNQSVSEGVEVDWGDGISEPFTVSGTGNVSAPTPHEYPSSGNYVITMTQKNDSAIMLGNAGTGSGILGDTGMNSNTQRGVLAAIETGYGVTTMRNYCCCRHTSLKCVILGTDFEEFGNYVFQYCYGLGSIHFLGPSLPANNKIGATNVWQNIPTWCKIYVPPAYMNGSETQNVPSRMPSSSTYTYAVEPYAYSAE